MIMSFVPRAPRQWFNTALLADLWQWWFKDVPGRYDVALPEGTMKRWFHPSPDVDEYCR
jgi:hypothetical protein